MKELYYDARPTKSQDYTRRLEQNTVIMAQNIQSIS